MEKLKNTTILSNEFPKMYMPVGVFTGNFEEIINRQNSRISNACTSTVSKNAEGVLQAFETIAQLDSGREIFLQIPEATDYAFKDFESDFCQGMSSSSRQMLFFSETYPFEKETVLKMVAHEHMHLAHHENIAKAFAGATYADIFCMWMYDEVAARLMENKVFDEAQQKGLISQRSAKEPTTVSDVFHKVEEANYPYAFILNICAQKKISPFLLMDKKIEHSNAFYDAIGYFQKTYPELAHPAILKKTEHLYQAAVLDRINELKQSGCKMPSFCFPLKGRE